MKTRMIKTLLIAVASIMYASSVWSQGIIVYKSDGTTERFSYAAIDSIVSYADYKEEGDKNGDNDDEQNKDEQYEAIDLGLSVKWATCNIGASSPEDYGGYYAWGETEEKTNYDWSTYKWCKGSFDSLTKYCTNRNYGTVDNKTTLDPEDDVAHVKWGGDWRMPTLTEIKELCEKCSWQWTEVNGVSGQKVTGPNGNSIFLPAAGFCIGTEVNNNLPLTASYWSSTLYDISNAYRLYFNRGHGSWYDGIRFVGNPVRPVTE